MQIKNQLYQTIIDSSTAMSIIAHSVVKELGLKIEHASNSLIVSAVRTSTRPLGIIRDLPIEIKGACIPITVEVVPATSYFLLLRKNLSRKVRQIIIRPTDIIHLNRIIRSILLLLLMNLITPYLNN